jgi:hypothetical protein
MLDEPAGQQARLAERALAVALAHLRRFSREVERLAGGPTHNRFVARSEKAGALAVADVDARVADRARQQAKRRRAR